MGQRSVSVLFFLLLLLPSAWFAWSNRDMPSFGENRDDVVYMMAAKSLAQGDGYRMTSLPGRPFETKYPPVLSAMLAGIWKAAPSFPANLPWAALLMWAFVPVFLWLAFLWFRVAGLTEFQSRLALAILACHPYTLLLGAGIFSEIPFAALLLGSLLCIERAQRDSSGYKWAAIAGVLGAAGYLTRTAGIALLVAGLCAFLFWRMWRAAVAFALPMLPAVAGWTLWCAARRSTSKDVLYVFYTDYLGFQFLNVRLDNFTTVIWANLSTMVHEMGAVLLPSLDHSFFLDLVRKAVAVAMVVGVVRHLRNRSILPYSIFTLISFAMLLVWHFPPELRFLYPVTPLLVYGLVREGAHFVSMVRAGLSHSKKDQRVAARGLAGAGALLACSSVFMFGSMDFVALPSITAGAVQVRSQTQAAYRWIDAHLGEDDCVLAQNPAVHLYTGHCAAGLLVLPSELYQANWPAILKPFGDVSAYATPRHLRYMLWRDTDYNSVTPGREKEAKELLERSAALDHFYRFPGGFIAAVVPDRTLRASAAAQP